MPHAGEPGPVLGAATAHRGRTTQPEAAEAHCTGGGGSPAQHRDASIPIGQYMQYKYIFKSFFKKSNFLKILFLLQ